jgi:uncharacterized protein YecE (DUF72 family)
MGFSYSDWKGIFYPSGMPARDRLAHYSRVFNAVELDTTFYATPRSEVVCQWAAALTPGFRFTAKTPKTITHEKGLVGVRPLMSEFLSVMRLLGDKLGVILIQMPPGFAVEKLPVLTAFLDDLPDDLRFAVEFRHRSWHTTQTADLLARRGVCWAATEYPNLPHRIIPTTDFLYIRWLGQRASFKRYDREQKDVAPRLGWWWEQIQPLLSRVPTVYGFFNNDYAGYAPATCNRFKAIAGLPVVNLQPPEQGKLF